MTLEAYAVHKSYGDVQALKNVDITVKKGELFTLLGPSGCGKTTLLRIIAGLEQADSGSVFLNGLPITDKPANERPVNTVFQSYALFPHMTNADNVAFGLRSQKKPESEIKQKVQKTLDMMELSDFGDRFPDQLSGGQRQRVAMARALVCQPELLLLDEPMSALDAKLRTQLQVQLRRLQQKLNKTFILVTHDQDEALTVSDRIAVMKDGEVLQCGSPRAIYDRPNCRFVAEFIGTANILEAERRNDQIITSVGKLTLPTLPQWKRGALVIRPEGIRLRDEEPKKNGVLATITETFYRGTFLDITLEPGQLRMRCAPHKKLAVGDKVWVELLEEALVAIDD
ncbi:ABC transporter ATP-binding protein [Pseudodesulfovibrio sediminis]|uniref:Spermidine/putrescine import ATP-binding protein PotA n=1 Tax=Pseudodesulfovibrio sediminis TaxID=2810563 RepID=A0ABN6EW50_9BACT|nr:ABC transporter ATP-binding protein [Pseudodesulfovibrio sediminis]BCS89763.1 spermidine/putrescine import ATP-binding protein PotA [Pseudodesulfovibrio sediminis]